MNQQNFKQMLQQLTPEIWNALFNGQNLLMKDDRELLIGEPDSANSIVVGSDYNAADSEEMKVHILENATEILSDYYRSNPLTQTGFNQQVEKLVEEFGFQAFCALQGNVANRTFFVEGGEVVSESLESPRHQYGVYFQSQQAITKESMPKKAMKAKFNHWLASGEAYSEYIGMNVCRYNC